MSKSKISSSISLESILEKVSAITLQIQQSQELESILQCAIDEIRLLLAVDRVLICQVLDSQDAVVAFESIDTDQPSQLGQRLDAPNLDSVQLKHGTQRRSTLFSDSSSPKSPIDHVEQRHVLQEHAALLEPLFSQSILWGFVIAYPRHAPRKWQPLEVQLLHHVALQLGVAIQQTVLRDQERVARLVQASEKALATAQRVAQIGNWSFDVATGKISWSDELFHLYGLNPKEPEPDLAAHIQLIHPDDRSQFQAIVQQALQTGEPYIIEFKAQRPDGSIQVVEGRGEAVLDSTGAVVGLFGTAQNITDRKHKEDLIQNVAQGVSATVGEAFFQSLVQFLIRLLGMDKAYVGELIAPDNQRMKIVAGLSQDQTLDGLELSLAGSPCEQAIKEGFCIYPEGVLQHFPSNLTLQMLGGQGYAGISLVSSAGTVIGCMSVISDQPIANVQFIQEVLTIFAVRAASELERQQSEAALRCYERIVSATPDCVSLIDRQYVYQVVNQTYLAWNQKTYSEIVGHSVSDLLGQAFFETASKPRLDRCLAGGPQQSFETWQHYPDGQRRYVKATYTPYFTAENTIAGVVINVHDLTDLKRTEEALRESEERFRQLATNIQEVFWMADIDFSRIIYISPLYEKIWGRSCASLYEQPKTFLEAVHPDDRAQAITVVEQQRHTGFDHEYRLLRPDGSIRWIWERGFPIADATGKVYRVVGVSQDITDRKAAETALREQQEFIEQIAQSTLAILYIYDLFEQRNIYVNQQVETVLGYTPDEIHEMGGALFQQLIHPDDLPHVMANQQHLLAAQDEGFIEVAYRMRHKAGNYRWLLSRDRIFSRTSEGLPQRSLGIATDITALKETQASLRQQVERQRLLMVIAQRIRQTLHLDHILQTTVTEVRQFLQTDRVIIYRFEPDWSGIIIAEAVAEGWRSILGMQITDTYFVSTQGHPYEQGNVKATDDIYTAQLDPCHVALLEEMQVRAKLVVPILQDDRLWGLLVAQHCRSPRQWDFLEVELQQQLATQIAIAIQQADLYRQSQLELIERERAEAALQQLNQKLEQLNQKLEQRVQERTQSLHQQAEQERLLRLIIQKIHSSFDVEETLETVLGETRQTFKVDRVAIYQFKPDWSGSFVAESVGEEWVPLVGPNIQKVWKDTHLQDTQGGRYRQNETFAVNDIYTVGHKQCHIDLLEQFQARAYAIAPIFVDEQLWGLLAVYQNSAPRIWQEWEISLLKQLGIQTAIALRQSYLYQAVQAQVKELERLNQLKDDFLSTVSHELRSPMSSIKMAIQMLEISLAPSGVLADETNVTNRYLRILRDEVKREVNLINDLLDLARLDAGTEPLTLTTINLQSYVRHLAEPFIERTRQQQQQFVLRIPDGLPPFTTDLPFLERILTELLHNACKYTPAGETITVTAQTLKSVLELRVSNSGVEIPATECDRIFDKFYRIPKNDPWKHGGTGLGLALVKKLTERLGGQIRVESNRGQTTFVLKFEHLNKPVPHPI